MTFRNRLYHMLVLRIPGISYRYQDFRMTHADSHRLLGLLYLLILNIRFYLFRDSSLKSASMVFKDDHITIPEQSESVTHAMESPIQLAERLLQADIISFDVFDTLILRPYRKPEDIFFDLELRTGYHGLRKLRMEAEQLARSRKGRNGEVTFEEIWNQLYLMTGLNPCTGMETEWAAEQDACFANPYFLEVVHLLREAGKQIIICSDMYLGADRIRSLLLQCGYPEFDRYFISCDHGASKSDGTLYDVVRTAIGASTKCIHIGDNPFSDQTQARKKGFETVYYRSVSKAGGAYRPSELSAVVGSVYCGIINTRLHSGRNQFNKNYELGFVYGGLLVTGYCQFIHRYVHRNGIDRILFLSRDGEILYKAYLQMYPQDASICRYVWWSRLAATKLAAPTRKWHYLTCMVCHKADMGYTVAQVMKTMSLDDMLDDLSRNGLQADDPLTATSAQQMCDYLSRRWDIVCAHYSDELREAHNYYAGMLSGASSAVAVDAGWVGSGPLLLKHLVEDVWNLGCTITGLMAGTCGRRSPDADLTAVELGTGMLVSYLFSDSHNRELWAVHDAAQGHNLLVELILSATTPSFRGFTRNADGAYCFSDHSEQINSAEIQQGILDFASAYCTHPLGHLDISGADAMAPIRILFANQHWVNSIISESGINACIE